MDKAKITMTRASFGGDGALLEQGKTYALPIAEARALVNLKKAVPAEEAAKGGKGKKPTDSEPKPEDPKDGKPEGALV